MQYDSALDKLCDDISVVLLEETGQSPRLVAAASRATRNLAAALRLSAGAPQDRLWYEALASLAHFVDLAHDSSARGDSASLLGLQQFLDENADVFAGHNRLERAS